MPKKICSISQLKHFSPNMLIRCFCPAFTNLFTKFLFCCCCCAFGAGFVCVCVLKLHILETPFFFVFFEQFRIWQILVVQAKSHQAGGENAIQVKTKTRMCSTGLVIKHYFSKSFLRYLHLCICLKYFLSIRKIGCSVADHNLCNTHETFGLPLFSFCLFAAKLFLSFSQVG